MPLDQMPAKYDLVGSKPDRLRYLADHIEIRVPFEEINMMMYHTTDDENTCNTAHCAYGHAELLPAFQVLDIPNSDVCTPEKMAPFFGLNVGSTCRSANPSYETSFGYCFGNGMQYDRGYIENDGPEIVRDSLYTEYTKADVVRHLRTAADALDRVVCGVEFGEAVSRRAERQICPMAVMVT